MLKEWLLSPLNKIIINNKINPNVISNPIRKKILIDKLLEFHIPIIENLSELLYMIINDKKGICSCGKATSFISFKQGYKEFCGSNCAHRYKSIATKKEQTCLKRYGCVNPNQVIEFKTKRKETCLERYGSNTPAQNKEIQNKIKKTMIENYGSHYFSSKIHKDNLLNKASILGFENLNQKHYTNYENFNYKFIKDNFCKNDKLNISAALSYFNMSNNMRYIFKEMGFIFNRKYATQDEFSFIKNSILNDRTFIKPLEIDILNHEFKFGLEYDGLMFHSFGKSKYSRFDNFEMEDKNYHLDKTKLVEDKKYQLFHIFENEWLDKVKKDIWISMLNSKMNNTNRIYARKTEIREVSYLESKTFLNNNHLQGSCKSNINLGLYYEDELVSLMTFGKARFSKKYDYELLRFCNVLNTTVVGGFSKLLSYFEKTYNPISLVSYANRRWSQGNVYEKNGFIFSHNSSPNYFYFKDNGELESRNKYQKHKLKNLLENFNPEATESINMFNHGYRRIWDCGNKVYYKEYKEYNKENIIR